MSPALPSIFIRNSPTLSSTLLKRQVRLQSTTTLTKPISGTRGFSLSSTTSRQVAVSSPLFPVSKRTIIMASTTPAKKEFLVIVPDKKGALAKRNEVRDQHLTNVKPLVEAGTVTVGGALMDAHPENGEAPQMNGSMLVVEAESVEKVRELIAKDIYATHGVWDFENADIRPFKTAVRTAKN